MADTVRPRGVDSSGRPILATDRMWDWWLTVVDELGFTPTIVQGAFMSRVPGGGASDSAGYHDLGACFDLRVWDLTNAQCERLVRVLREWGAAAWRRDQRHGMDPHIHFVLGSDRPWASGAASQWNAYLAGRDGLASNGADYEWRPNPLVLRPPEDDMPAPKDWTKADWDAFNANAAPAFVAAVLGAQIETPKGKRAVSQVLKELWNKRNV